MKIHVFSDMTYKFNVFWISTLLSHSLSQKCTFWKIEFHWLLTGPADGNQSDIQSSYLLSIYTLATRWHRKGLTNQKLWHVQQHKQQITSLNTQGYLKKCLIVFSMVSFGILQKTPIECKIVFNVWMLMLEIVHFI